LNVQISWTLVGSGPEIPTGLLLHEKQRFSW